MQVAGGLEQAACRLARVWTGPVPAHQVHGVYHASSYGCTDRIHHYGCWEGQHASRAVPQGSSLAALCLSDRDWHSACSHCAVVEAHQVLHTCSTRLHLR